MAIYNEWAGKLVEVDILHVMIACGQSWHSVVPPTDRWYRTLRDLLLAGF